MPRLFSVAVNEFDVIVVGGGPAGSAAAAFCAQRGRRVALFEHKKFPRPKVCGDVINPNCWPVLERLGVAEKLRALPHHQITGARFTTSTGAVAELEMIARAIRRSLFDAVLLDHARACGVAVFEEETVLDVPGRREAVTRKRRYLPVEGIVGADGRNSVVARKAGLARPGHGGNGHVALQAHFRAPPAMDDAVQLHLFAGGYCGVVRVDAQRVNLCIVTDRSGAWMRDDCEKLFERTVLKNRQFRSLGIAPEPLEPLQSLYPLQTPMNDPARDGVLLVGDALRVTEPFTGQGIFFALRTGELAARAICAGEDFVPAVTSLYRARGRTNELLRRLMYRPRMATAVMDALRHWPGAVRWLAGNVARD